MRSILCISLLLACLGSFQANPVEETPIPHPHVEPLTGAPTTLPTVAPTVTPTPAPTPAHHVEPITANIVEGGKTYQVTCHAEGSMRHPGNVHKYIICEYMADHLHWTVTVMPCSIGTKFDESVHNCVLDN